MSEQSSGDALQQEKEMREQERRVREQAPEERMRDQGDPGDPEENETSGNDWGIGAPPPNSQPRG